MVFKFGMVEEPKAIRPAEALSRVVEAWPRVDWPVTVSDPKVPTDVSDELTTFAPKVVASKILTLLIDNSPPVGRLMLPEVRVNPPEKVEVAESPTMVVVAVPPM